MITGQNQTANEKLKNYADAIFMRVPVQAQRPPSRLIEEIPDTEKMNLHVRDDCESFGSVLDQDPRLINARVRKADLVKFIEWAKADSLG
jgi:hypothetical protein